MLLLIWFLWKVVHETMKADVAWDRVSAEGQAWKEASHALAVSQEKQEAR